MSLSVYCPHCGKYTSVERLITTTSTTIGNRPVTFPTSWYNSKIKKSWWMAKCNSCEGVMLVLDEGEVIYPTPQPSPTDVRIPEIIKCDIQEAKKCFSVSAFSATVVMARRAVESICIDKGANKGNPLHKQIEEIRQKGIITEDLKEWATEVRYTGNTGAHAGMQPTRQDAESILHLAEQFAHVIYVLPEMAKELRSKRI